VPRGSHKARHCKEAGRLDFSWPDLEQGMGDPTFLSVFGAHLILIRAFCEHGDFLSLLERFDYPSMRLRQDFELRAVGLHAHELG